MITAEVLGVEKVLSWYQSMPHKGRSIMTKRIAILAVMLRDYIKLNYLTGQALHVRTGRLRRSITSSTSSEGNMFFGIVGTNVEYAAAHEYGCHETVVVTVREYFRRTKGSMRAAKIIGWRDGKGSNSVARSAMLGAALVHSFTRHQHINLPERSFMRAGLRDLAPGIREDLIQAMREALQDLK